MIGRIMPFSFADFARLSTDHQLDTYTDTISGPGFAGRTIRHSGAGASGQPGRRAGQGFWYGGSSLVSEFDS